MTITLDVPSQTEDALLRAWGQNLNEAVLGSLLIEGYRTGRLSTGDLADALGLETRFEAEKWLSARGMHLNYSLADLNDDLATLDRVLGPIAK